MKKLALLFFVPIVLLAMDNNSLSSIKWGEKSFFEKNYADAILFCSSYGQRLPNDEETDTLCDKKYSVLSTKHAEFDNFKNNVVCVIDDNKSSVNSQLAELTIACMDKYRPDVVEQAKQVEDNRTTSEKFNAGIKEIGSVALTVTEKLADLTIGIALSAIPGGGGISMVPSS